MGIPAIVLFADLEELEWIIRNNTVDPFIYTPPHHTRLVDSPHKDGAARSPGVSKKLVASWSDKDLLEHVERNIGNFEELAGVENVKADVGDWKPREVFVAKGEVFGL